MFQKSDAKIEITITTTNLIRIKYPLSSFNYHLSGVNVANFNKIHCTVFEQQLFKKMELKNRTFQYGKSRLSSSYAIPSVTGLTMTLVTLLIHLQILKWKECLVRLNYPHLDVMVFLRGCFVNVLMN